MILEKRYIKNPKTKKFRAVLIVKCDECQIEYMISYGGVKSAEKKSYHFHNRACGAKSNLTKQKRIETCLKRFGVEHPLQSSIVQDKIEQTCLERYGVKHTFKAKKIKEKRKESMIERYGTEHALQSPVLKQKQEQTCINRYGVPNAFQSKEKQEIICNTMVERYGVEHALQSPVFREKFVQTSIKNWGTDHPLQSSVVQDKIEQTCLERYGVTNVFKCNEILEKAKQTCISRYGVPNPMQDLLLFKKVQKSRKITHNVLHWKTQEELSCTGNYELAFVNWCNHFKIDFDWQIKFVMPDNHVHFIDAFIKDGKFKNTWIEVKGYFPEARQGKWKWFHSTYSNSELWNKQRLEELQILIKGKPNEEYKK